MIIDHSSLSLNYMKGDKSNLLQETLHIVILIEFLRGDLLRIMSGYIQVFSSQEQFDYDVPISYFDFNQFIKHNYSLREELWLDQFIFNLQLLSIKIYSLLEKNKSSLKDTSIKKLRLSFAHRKSPFILSNKEKLVLFVGFSYDLDYFEIMNVGYKEDGVSNEIIPFKYGHYIQFLSDNFEHNLFDNIKQIRDLNQMLLVR